MKSEASASAIGVVDTNGTVRDTQTFAEMKESLNIVVNLSSHLLSQEEKAVLSKGLKYCPTPTDIDMYEVRWDINEFLRRIRLGESFHNDDDDDVEGDFSEAPAFRKNSTWQPNKYRELAIEAYAKSSENQIITEIHKTKKS